MIRIIALTEAGLRLAQKLNEQLNAQSDHAEVLFKPKPFAEKVQQFFSAGDSLILICATGIAVRTLAPVLNNKHQDPPVLVLDELGQFVIPLISGHEGGANDWGNDIAKLLDAQLVMTTAKPYLKPVYTVGMGCERNCPEQELNALLMKCLAEQGLELNQISSVNSIDIKADEVGLIELGKSLDLRYQTFDKNALATVEHLLSTKSDYIFKTVGVYGVAESAALLAAQEVTGEVAELVFNKQKTAKATCAIARSYPIQEK
ncbi:MAG: cobalamin biosynthesis protein [Pseudomonadales bacterium]|nr:cobalamin biosynthesis protein [Pseudomonadales bacterium]